MLLLLEAEAGEAWVLTDKAVFFPKLGARGGVRITRSLWPTMTARGRSIGIQVLHYGI